MCDLDEEPKLLLIGGGMSAVDTARILMVVSDMNMQVVNVGTPGHIDHGKGRDLLLNEAMETYALEYFEPPPELPASAFKNESSWHKLNKGKLSKKARRK